MLGPPELLVITAGIVLFFGYKKIPDLGHNLGKATEYLRNADDLDDDTLDTDIDS